MIGPAEYFVSHVIEGTPTSGVQLEKWPLHMTVVPPFTMGDYTHPQEVLATMQRAGQAIGPLELEYGAIDPGAIPLVPGEWDRFGENNDIKVVRVLDPSGKLRELHKLLIHDIGGLGCEFLNLDPKWSGNNYHPHATTKSGSILDHPFFCSTLSLHKKREGLKKIVGTVDMYTQTVL